MTEIFVGVLAQVLGAAVVALITLLARRLLGNA
jgi:hypothetical protein